MRKVLCVSVVVMIALFGCSGSTQDENAASEQPAAQDEPAAAAPDEAIAESGTDTPSDAAMFSLDDVEPLAQTKELADIPESELEAIYKELHAANLEANRTAMAQAGDDTDRFMALQENLHLKNKYQVGKKYGLTIEQVDRLVVMGTKNRW